MYNIKLGNLDTGKIYYVKVRAKVHGYETSEWSIPFKFETPRDTMPPGRIESLSFLSEGDSFIANWDAPPHNEDGTPCGDISHYRLVFKDLDNDRTRTVTTADTSFAMDFNRNVEMFGTPAGRLQLTVTVFDLSGNESKTVVAIAQNPPPSKVQNVTAAVGVESIALKWDANTENDLANYEVHVGNTAGFAPSTSTLRAKVAPGTDSFTYDTASLSVLYFKILAVDKFFQKSEPSDVVSAQPRLTTDYDKEPPGAVTGFTVTQVLASDNATATAQINYSAVADDDLDKYEVQYRKTGETTLPWSFATIPSDQTTAEIKPLPLATSYDFRIRAVDFNSNKGAWSSVVVAPGVKKTSLPDAPTDITVRGGLTNLMITWTESTDPSMANWAGTYEVQIDQTSSFESPTTIKTSSTLASFISLDANTIYHVRIRSIDPFLNIGSWSETLSGNTGQVADPNASKVIWSETEPENGTENDLWMKLPENIQYRFDGTNWVKAQDQTILQGLGNKVVYGDSEPIGSFEEGDTWFKTPDYVTHLYVDGEWVNAQATLDDRITDAIATADGKNTIYYADPPTVGIKEGDTWFDGPTIRVYTDGQWVDASKSLDNSQAEQAIQIAGSKNKTYYVAKDSATGMIEGDVLFDPTEGNKQYRYNGSEWLSTQDAATIAANEAAGRAQETADKKNTIYYSTPPATGLNEGDTWFDGPSIKTYQNGEWVNSSIGLETDQGSDALDLAGTKNKTFYRTYANRPASGLTEGDILFDPSDKYRQYRWDGSAWVSVRDETIEDAQDTATAALDSANSRNRNIYAETNATGTSLNGYSFINGDTWYKKDSSNTITAMWEFVDGSWVSKELNNQVIANLDAGKITSGYIDADRIDAETITGTMIAGESIVVGNIEPGAIDSTVIKDGAITTAKVHAEAITSEKIQTHQINASHIVSTGLDGSVVITNGTVTATQIAGETITGDKISGNTIDAGHIVAGSIQIGGAIPEGHVETPDGAQSKADTAKTEAVSESGTNTDSKVATALQTAASDAQEKADAAASAAQEAAELYADGEITSATAQALIDAAEDAQEKADAAKEAAEGEAKSYTDGQVGPISNTINDWTETGTTFIDGGKIYTDSITAGQIAANAITANELAADAVTANKIKAGEIDASKIVSSGLDGSTVITDGTIRTSSLDAEAVTSEKIAAGTIVVGNIADDAITGTKIAGDAITTGHIQADAITSSQIAAGEILAEHIRAGAITIGGETGHIPDGQVALPSDVEAAEQKAADELAALNTVLVADATDKANAAQEEAIRLAELYANSEIEEAEVRAAVAAADVAEAERIEAIRQAKEHTDSTVLPINNTLNGWRFGDTTYINGGSIRTRTIDAGSIKADSISADEIMGGTITAEEIAGNTITADEIQARSITGEELEANLAVINNLKVRSSIDIDAAGGHIKSSNYNANGSAGFYMDQQQLIINQGRVEAAAIKLQDSSNLMPAGFASFNFNSDYYNKSRLWASFAGTLTHAKTGGVFGGGYLQVNYTANGMIILSETEKYNIPTEPSTSYIVSFYINNRSGKAITLDVSLYRPSTQASNAVNISIPAAQGWNRYSAVLTTPNASNHVLRIGTWAAPGTFWIDGIQVEKKIAALDTPSSWSPPGFTSIDGESITTGSISSTDTISTPNGNIARWSIDTAGRARFADATIDGKLVVGADVSNKEATSIQSDTYSAGLAGWAIKGNGDAEFNDGTFRGVLNLTSPGAGESAPTLTASVRPTDLYVTSAEKKTIHIAGIRGQVTGYTREEVEEESGQYLPTIPDPSKRARYFIGPTTDRSLTIQVHDSSDTDDVAFLDEAPSDVNLTLINIGEITRPSEEPSGYLDQGFSHRSGAGDSANYARVEQASTATTGTPEDIRSSHVLSIESRSDLHKRTSQASLALSSDPAESNATSMNLSVTEFHESAGGIVSDSAEYTWSPQGISYPGTAAPFMPTAVSILWDWSALSTSNRPHVGGSSRTRIINTGTWGRINTGEGRSYIDKFDGPEEKPLRGGWISYGSPKAFKKGGQVQWASGKDWNLGGIHSDYYIYSAPLGSSNHDVSGQYGFWHLLGGLGGGYYASGTIICSYDPVTRDGIFFRFRDNGVADAAEIFVRKNGQERRIWSSSEPRRYRDYEQRLVRDGNVVRGYLNGNLVATVTDNDLPSGEHFGFSLYSARITEIQGKATVPGSDAQGMLEPGSMNINNRRGITINTNGIINIDTPGYYIISAAVVASFGGHFDRQYWMAVRHSGGEYAIGHPASRYDGGGFTHMQGTLMGHMQGRVELVIMSNNISTQAKMTAARLEIARVA